MKGPVLFLMTCMYTHFAQAQHIFKAIVKDAATHLPIAGANFTEGKKGHATNDSGIVTMDGLSAGPHRFTLTCTGYETSTVTVALPDTSMHEILLTPQAAALEEVTVLASTRTNQRIENSPLKVEVLGLEEMNEENTIKPGNIASILGDVSGIQIQQSSAVSGNANVRIQGLDGRYTQILRDGMPLFDGFSGGFGILTIPPLNLKQVELIKGSASTLYGGGAIGGLINLISKKPAINQEGVLTINGTTLQEGNVNTYVAKKYKTFGYNLFGGTTQQAAVDVDGDGLSDVARTNAVVLHPRIFFYPNNHTSIAIGYTGTFETRKGGDMQVLNNKADAIHRFYERNKTNRNTIDLVADHASPNGNKLQLKASRSSFQRGIATDTHVFQGTQSSYFTEASFLIIKEKYNIIMGANALGDRFGQLSGDPVLLQDFHNNTIGAFVQSTINFPSRTTLELGLREDHHFTYGNFVLPRLAVIHRFSDAWAVRAGTGFGYKAPNALAQQNIEYDIKDIRSLPARITAEKSIGYNAEINYKKELGPHGSLFINNAFFLTRISDPVIATVASDNSVNFSNAAKSITSKGFDTYVQAHLQAWEFYLGYTFTIAKRNYLSANTFMPLTPKHRMAFVVAHEPDDKWRFGLEGSYNGRQYRDNDTRTPGYMFLAGLVERKFGDRISVVLNCENLLDYRQSRHEALYTGTITAPVFKPLWAPIDGRVTNLAIRWKWAK